MTVGIVGTGRAGIGLALALRRAGIRVLGVHGRRAKRLPGGLRLTVGGAPPWLRRADVVLLAVRDDALGELVRDLAREGPTRRGQVVLHLSGLRTAAVLAPLAGRGAHGGSMHPLMTVSGDPRRAARHLAGATFALEGHPAAVRTAGRLARALGGSTVTIAPGRKAAYHAGAVFASNYVVVVMDAAEAMLVAAGFARPLARRALGRLARASLDNVLASGPESALTGPVARGDAATVGAHLRALPGPARGTYVALARAALAVALRAGLPAARARALRSVLR